MSLPNSYYEYLFYIEHYAIKYADIFISKVGFLFVMFGFFLIFLIGGTQYYCVIQLVSDSLIERAIHSVLVGFFLFCIYFNYALCVTTCAGNVEEHIFASEDSDIFLNSDESDQEKEESSLSRRNQESPQQVTSSSESDTFCKRCDKYRPARAHHCSVCKKCVLRMDHHCPWIDNCVGQYNIRYFISFLFWITVGCLYSCLISLIPFLKFKSDMKTMLKLIALKRDIYGIYSFDPQMMLVLCLFLSLGLFIAVGLLLVWNVYLVLTGQTAIEFHINLAMRRRVGPNQVYINIYDHGYKKNWELVFGERSHPLCGLLPNTLLQNNQNQNHIV